MNWLTCNSARCAAGASAALWLAGTAWAADVTAVFPVNAARSSPVTITGAGFGAKGSGRVMIGGQRAWSTEWADGRIVAYVPEGATVGAATVEVVHGDNTAAGPAIAVQPRAGIQPRGTPIPIPKPVQPQSIATSRPSAAAAAPTAASGAVAWRFEVLANYISHRADVGRDGTVYFSDSSGYLYALTRNGALKWIYDGEGSGSQGPVVVGADGTIYFGTATRSAVHAVNPDGSRKWMFEAPKSQGIIGGPGIGPDGNIYAVFDRPGQIGAVSLTPAGAVRWKNAGDPRVSEYGQVGRELVFGGGNVYFTSRYYGPLYAFDIGDGHQRFRVDLSRPGQAVAGRDGTVYVPTGIAPRLVAYSRRGEFLGLFFGDDGGTVTNDLSSPDIGRDGSLFITRNLLQLYSLSPAPAVNWVSDSLLAQGPVPGPIASPDGTQVLLGGHANYGEPGLIQGFAAANGALQFQIPLPYEADGTCAVPYARARYEKSGKRAYIPAVQLCVAPQTYHSWLYAVDVAQP